jgi:hypothetical protein
MKKQNSILAFACGALLGVGLMLCIGAAEKETAPPKKDWSRLHLVTYPSGTTGFFDSATGMLYLYDADLRNCYLTRQLTALGAPLSRP